MEHLIEMKTALTDIKKAKISEIMAESDIKVLQGGDEELNLMHCLISVG